ncbi:hypothetical protein GDO81_024524 [Engystomops pustulosus]|uniref:Uncharacterized protein n=1 Tax=Engystomops pustulosus TaxID=76066 RepID=A0AAV6YIY8_ENGPU|nr:hypothetical protein GDO81_024524 [Engystomops pustulosus]
MVKKNRREGDSGFSLPGEDHRSRRGRLTGDGAAAGFLSGWAFCPSGTSKKFCGPSCPAPPGKAYRRRLPTPGLPAGCLRRLLKKNPETGTSRKNRRPKPTGPTFSAPSAAERSSKNTGQRRGVWSTLPGFCTKSDP